MYSESPINKYTLANLLNRKLIFIKTKHTRILLHVKHFTIKIAIIMYSESPINKYTLANLLNRKLIFIKTKHTWILLFLVEHFTIKNVGILCVIVIFVETGTDNLSSNPGRGSSYFTFC